MKPAPAGFPDSTQIIVLGTIGLHARPTKIARLKKDFFFVRDRLGG
jgi:hypothetical protein